jgi:hypothetical protein
VPGGAPALSAAEVKRSTDACQAYVSSACACADKVAAAKPACEAAKAIPDSIRMALAVANAADSKPEDVRHTQKFVRDAVAECIQETARLPALGCPQ